MKFKLLNKGEDVFAPRIFIIIIRDGKLINITKNGIHHVGIVHNE